MSETSKAAAAAPVVSSESVTGQPSAAADDAEAQADMRAVWGDRYRDNKFLMDSFADAMPEAERKAFLAKEASPQEFAEFAKRVIIPKGPALGQEIARIEKLMRDDRGAYNRDEKIQARYRVLIEARGLPKHEQR